MIARGPIGSFRAIGSGLILALGPSLVIAMADPVSLRALVLGLACSLVVLVGALQRWSAPMLIGGAVGVALVLREVGHADVLRSEEHTSELQSLMSISYAVFCLKKN